MNDNARSQSLPQSLKARRHAALRQFRCARDPLYMRQLEAMQKTESQRREDQGRGSMMVKLDKPFPELKPKQETTPLRSSFNQAWLKEKREARMHMYANQRKETKFPEKARESLYSYER